MTPAAKPPLPGLDQQAKDSEAGFVTESGQQFGGGKCFHISNNIEILLPDQDGRAWRPSWSGNAESENRAGLVKNCHHE